MHTAIFCFKHVNLSNNMKMGEKHIKVNSPIENECSTVELKVYGLLNLKIKKKNKK